MQAINTIDRYWQTIRRLRPIQVSSRIGLRLKRPKVDLRPAPPLRPGLRTWVRPAQRKPSLQGEGAFFFLNEPGALTECGWDDPRREKLWRYNQHYFDDLNATDFVKRAAWHGALIADWLSQNPPSVGTGWEPYPTSLRIVNWIKWSLAGGQLTSRAHESLAAQVRWLTQRLEYHLLGNHLFANAKALVFAGLYFDGPEAHSWRQSGLAILEREFDEQILADGGQFELSPMYHALALEDVLDLINIARCYDTALTAEERRLALHWQMRVAPMLEWLEALSHPDGQIAFFNDAAFKIAPDNHELHQYATRLGFAIDTAKRALTWLEASGYAKLRQPDAELITDMARIGPDYLPGHAHADTLSFELSLFDSRVFVNSGTSLYGLSDERLRQRGTSAHNTVLVEGQNSSDVWSGFRVGRRARCFDQRVERTEGALIAEAKHNGYRHLPGRPIHHRRWELSRRSLRVIDRLSAPNLRAAARFHLHPQIYIEQTSPSQGRCTLPDGRLVKWDAGTAPIILEPSSWHPEFGKSVPTTCLVVPLINGRAVFELSWA
jgi:uncharacterized heparinase superfamily protein